MLSAKSKKKRSHSGKGEIAPEGIMKKLHKDMIVKKELDEEEDEDESRENLHFEDPYEEEYEDEEIIADSHDMDMEDGEGLPPIHEDEEEEDETTVPGVKKVWRPGHDELAEGEEMVYDSSAYIMYHSLKSEWPCLSFDILRDNLGVGRTKFPMTAFIVAGTQAAKEDGNKLMLLKMSELHKTQKDDESNSEDESDDDENDEDPVMEMKSIPHKGCVNRVRVMPQQNNIVATWSDSGSVNMFNVSKQLNNLIKPGAAPVAAGTGSSSASGPIFSFNGHPEEGFAMDWSKVAPGRFVSGDCKKHIYLWEPNEGLTGWAVDKVPFSGHSASVEDLQWSPTEATVFGSCSVDGTVKIWDTRTKKNSMLSVDAHESDVNVISWNPNVGYLMISGSDDGTFKIWDLRSFKTENFVAHYKWHTAPITSVEWHPTDESVLAVSGADNQITLWDLALEADDEPTETEVDASIPPQLLFIHQGQTDIKELHFHPQMPGVIMSTALDGFNIFKPDVTE